MLDFVKNYIFKSAASQALKALLDKVPGSGGKTVLGVLLVVLSAVAQAVPNASYIQFVQILIDIVNGLGPNVVHDLGLISLIVGVVHKILKYFNPELPDAPKLVQ